AARAQPDQPGLMYWDFSYDGPAPPADAPPRPPDYSLNQGPAHVQAAGNWTVSRALGANFNLSAWRATSPYHRITRFSRLDLPTGRENEIRAKYYPVPPGLKPADRQAHDEAYSAEYKRARQDAGR